MPISDDEIAAAVGGPQAAQQPQGLADSDIASIVGSPAAARQSQVKPDELQGGATQKKPLREMPYVDKVIASESGGNPNAHAHGTSASGLGQFTDQTWIDTARRHVAGSTHMSDQGLLSLKSDPGIQRQMIEALGNDNESKLSAAGIPVNDASKYGAHWFGADNFQKIYNAEDSAPIESIIGDETAKNNGLSGKNAGQVRQLVANRMGMDYMPKNMDWSDAIEQAGENLPSSAGNAALGIYHAVRHPIDTATALYHIGQGLDSKANRAFENRDQPTDEENSKEATVNALIDSYKDKYGSLEGFKQYFANDPIGVAFDASTALGGAGAVGKLAGMGKIGAGLSAAGEAANPLNLVGRGVRAVTAPAPIVDAAGRITPKVDQMIRSVSGGRMTGADLTPQALQRFTEVVNKKGLSEDSVREGIMRSAGLDAPTQSVTGHPAIGGARETTEEAIKNNNVKLAQQADKLAGTGSPTDLGAAIDQAHVNSFNRASSAYDKIRAMPGSFGRKIDLTGMQGPVAQRLNKAGLPWSTVPSQFPQTNAALKMLSDTWGSGKSLLKSGSGQIDSPEILAMQKTLNGMKATARGADSKGVAQVQEALNDHISGLANRGLFRDATGKPITGLPDRIKAADKAYKAHFDTFEDPNGANNTLVSLVRKLKSGQTRNESTGVRYASGDHDLYRAAQNSVGKDLFSPVKGKATYNQLTQAIGSKAPVDDFMRQQLLNTENGMLRPPKNAGDALGNLQSPDAGQIRHIHAASAINNAKPSLAARHEGVLRSVAGSMLGKGIGSLAGYETLGPAGLIAGPVVEGGLERLRDSSAAKAAMKGAPYTSGRLARTAKGIARRVTSPVGMATEHYADQASEPQNAVISRASGGRVSIESLVDKLVHKWKRAKREETNHTKPLLASDDSHIAKALAVAQEAI